MLMMDNKRLLRFVVPAVVAGGFVAVWLMGSPGGGLDETAYSGPASPEPRADRWWSEEYGGSGMTGDSGGAGAGNDTGRPSALSPSDDSQRSAAAGMVDMLADQFSISVDGKLRLGEGTREQFELALSMIGDAPAELEALAEALAEALGSPAGEQAAALLRDYAGYRQAEEGYMDQAMFLMPEDGSEMAMLEQHLEDLAALRREHFDEDIADSLFAQDEQMARYELERLRLEQDPALDEQARSERLAELEESLPEEYRSAVASDPVSAEVNREVDRLRSEGADERAILEARAEHLGWEAAEELQRSEQAMGEWDARVDGYLSARDALRAQEGLADADRQRQLDQLRRDHFEEHELDGLRAYERYLDSRR